ncbi:hypothetical protein EDB89DRAFT_2065606 [Lactarius sanguifluus]|nr:hypothetical protein EDB89DRAFT_2065606 [Lactarius sanguifluus]
MTTTPLDTLASYTTPTQPDPNMERAETPQAKRGRETPETPKTHQNAIPKAPGKTPTSHPHAPSLSPARPLPVFNLPRFNNEHSPLHPPSPTSEAQKRRKMQTQNNREQNQTQEREMEVDIEGTNWFNQTPARLRGEPQENALDNTDPQTEENTIEIDEQENAKTLAHIMAASDNSPDFDNGTPFPNPLDRYTKGLMPRV